MISSSTIKNQAKELAKDNRKAEPSITKVYWFPNDKEVRLVELTDIIPQNDDGELHPFFFRSSPQNNLPAPSGIAMIRPDEYGKLKLPDDWGKWEDAQELDDIDNI